MNKAAGAVIMAAVGTAAVRTYASMKPRAKNQLKKEFRDTFHHLDDVKEELCHVRDDMSGMAKTLKNQM